MEQPNTKTTLRDAARGVTFHVVAYRNLTEAEAISAIRHFMSRHKTKLKRGSEITIMTIIGHRE